MGETGEPPGTQERQGKELVDVPVAKLFGPFAD